MFVAPRPTRRVLALLAVFFTIGALIAATPGPAHAANATTIDLENVETAINAGAPDSIKVTAKDDTAATDTGYTGTVTFSASCGDCFTITPNNGTGADAKKRTFVAGDAGTIDFVLTWTSAGTNRTFIATATLNPSGTNVDSQSGINVSPAPATSVELANVDTAVTVNTADPISVLLKSNPTDVDTAYTGTVTFTSSCDPGCFTITPNNGAGADATKYTYTAGDAGNRAFNLTWLTVGSARTLTTSATLTSGGPATDAETGINVTSADPTTVVLAGVDPAPQTFVSDPFTVTIKNAQDETVTGYTGTVVFSTPDCASAPFHITPNDGGVNAKKYTFVAGDLGTKAFNIQWTFPGSCNFTVTAPLPGDTTDTDAVTVVAANRPAVRVIVTGVGAGGGPHVQALRAADFTSLHSFYAYAPGFTGGVNVAAGDVNGDGTDDIITAAGPGGGPHVRVLNGIGLAEIASFYAYPVGFTGGVYVAAGDVNGDGNADVITGAGPGGGPHVRGFSGAALAAGATANAAELFGYYAYAPTFTGGVTVGAANLDGDASAEIVTGAGPGGGPHVRLLEAAVPLTEVAGTVPGGFYAYAPTFTGGVFVGAHRDSSSISRVITGAGPGGGRHVRVFNTNGVELFSRIVGPGPDGAVPALGNIDGDADDEVLVAAVRNSGTVQRFDLTGTELSSLPAYSAAVGVRPAVGTL